MRLEQAKLPKILDRENKRLKKLVADRAIDIAIFNEVSSGQHRARTDGGARSSACVESRACRSAGSVGVPRIRWTRASIR